MALLFFCSLAHAVSVLTLWNPAHHVAGWLAGWLKAIAASISLITALVLVAKLPELRRISDSNRTLRRQAQELRAVHTTIGNMLEDILYQ